MRRMLFYVFLLWSSAIGDTAWAGLLSGTVRDVRTGAAIAGCAVYINYTTIGTATDQQGNFRLDYDGGLPADLIIQSIGYEVQAIKINTVTDQELTIALSPRSEALEEVEVLAPLPDGWERFGQDFLDNFVGYSDWGKNCVLLNREVLVFRYDAQKNVLRVQAKVPLRIRHKDLGYIIHYDLQDFTLNYKDRTVFYSGYARYETLPARRKRLQAKIVQNRRSAFAGSLNHFVRAVYTDRLAAEGFEVRRLQRIKNTEYGRYVPVRTDTLYLNRREAMKALLQDMAAHPGIDSVRLIPMILSLKQWLDTDSATPVAALQIPLRDTTRSSPYHYVIHKTDTPQKVMLQYYQYDRLCPEDSSRLPLIHSAAPLRLPERWMDIVYQPVLPSDSFRINEGAQILLQFDGYLQVSYTREPEELAFRQRMFQSVVQDRQQSILTIRGAQKELELMPDGNFSPVYDLFLEGYWYYEKLDKQLPLDYQP